MLTGGVKGCAGAGEKYTNLMDEYHPEVWITWQQGWRTQLLG